MLEVLGEALESGAVVARSYRLQRVVGEGGMGVVWAAHELKSDRPVALKFLREGHETDPRNQERFLREARAAMGISHPNVARVEAVLETDAGVPFLVMDLLEGESLRSMLQRRRTLSAVECARILLPVVDAVAAAHASGVVHRDLKPENVFLVHGEHVRVLDFGIAKLMPKGNETASASLTSTGALLGTPIYMAPEQIFGDDDVDGRADVWALGIIVYECLAGRRPTEGDGFGPIIKRITTETLVPLEHARTGLPPAVTRLVGKMLSRSRDERPTLHEIRGVLASVLDAGEDGAAVEQGPVVTLRIPNVASPAAMSVMVPGGPSPTAPTPAAPVNSPAVTSPPPRSRVFVAIAITGATLVAAALGSAALFLRVEKRRPVTITPIAPVFGDAGAAPWLETSRLIHEANAAQQRRDGVTCLARLDQYDRDVLIAKNGRVSTDPVSGFAGSRAICMMLAGRCTEGKALYRAWITPFVVAGMNLDDTVESIVVDSCEGDQVTPREALLRVHKNFVAVSMNKRTPTRAECTEWRAAEQRLLAKLPDAGTPTDRVWQVASRLEDDSVGCFARAGDCDTALGLSRAEYTKQGFGIGLQGADHEAAMRRSYDLTVLNTPCRGRP